MNILIVNNGFIPVLNYGGSERVIWYLGRELVRLGHKVTFLVNSGSYCDFADVIHINPAKDLVSQIPEYIDIVHFNSKVPKGYLKPHIVTIHGNEYIEDMDINTVFVSKNHAVRNNSLSYVYNGMDWDDYGKVNIDKQRNYYHFLGKAAWRIKNVRGAIKIVDNLNGEKLYVLGGHRFNLKMGIRFTFSPNIRFFGMVGGQQKLDLLSASKGLIFPVLWDEPFGLAITESLYFGSPVYGTKRGSLPELVNSEVGFLSDSEMDIADHIKSGIKFSAKNCHDYAVECFNSKKMALSYLNMYEMVLNGETLNPQKPFKVINV